MPVFHKPNWIYRYWICTAAQHDTTQAEFRTRLYKQKMRGAMCPSITSFP